MPSAYSPASCCRYVSIRQHTSADVYLQRFLKRLYALRILARILLQIRMRQHTSAYVSIRQHTSADVYLQRFLKRLYALRILARILLQIRQHASAYVSIRQQTPANVCPPHTRPHFAAALPRYSLYLLYWYKSTNTDAEALSTCSTSTLLALLVQK